MDTDIQKNKTPRDRSSSYPAVSLSEAILLVDKVKKALANAPFNRENGAKALGYNGVTGASAPKIAALVHFGLLTRTGDVYKISPIADRILIPRSDEDKILAIREALLAPKLFRDLVEKFKGQSIPTLLSNILVHDHGISEKVSKQVAADFISSVEFAGIALNGIILSPSEQAHDDKGSVVEGMSSLVQEEHLDTQFEKKQELVSASNVGQAGFERKYTYGIARMFFPAKMKKSEFEKMTQAIESLIEIEE